MQNTPQLLISPNPNYVPEAEHTATSLYVERYWLPILGPGAIVIIRRIEDLCDQTPNPNGRFIDMAGIDIAKSFGLGGTSTLRKKLARLANYQFAEEASTDMWIVATRLPNLTFGMAEKLPPHLIAQHRKHHDIDRRNCPTSTH